MRRPLLPAPPARHCMKSDRGFTLIELIVSLVAGLIIAIAVVGLSKQATNTFHEEARAASAEMALRVGVERLRTDLERAAYMSTGNILADDLYRRTSGHGTHNPGATPLFNVTSGAHPGLLRMAGVHLYMGGSSAATPLSTDALNGLNPDAIELGGNYSSAEEYWGGITSAPAGDGAACGTQVFSIMMGSPAAWRLVANASPAAALTGAFHPGDPASPGFATAQYMARVVDRQGHTQFLATCPGAGATFYLAGPPAAAYINIASDTIYQTSKTLPATPWLDSGFGSITINPVEIVRWDLRPVTTLPATFFPPTAAPADPKEYVLARQMVDSNGFMDPSTLEVVAEYAVDLKFAFSVDPTPYAALPAPGQYPGSTTPLLHLGFDTTSPHNNGDWAYDVSAFAYGASPTIGPQRIRSVRARVATRTALPDRSQNPAPAPDSGPGTSYLYRYCISPPCLTGSQTWARVRTAVTEVALGNQARSYY